MAGGRAAYVAAVAAGEGAGIAGVALAYAASGRGYLPEAPAILTAGAWEGLCLGTAQAVAAQGLPRFRFVLATVVIAVLGYAGSLAAGAGGGEEGPEPALSLLVALAAFLGLFLGVLMGMVQAAVARHRLPFLGWTWRTAVGWTVAMPAIFAGSAVVTEAMSLVSVALAGLVAGAVAGAAIGLATVSVARP